jgi:hypothetical protein
VPHVRTSVRGPKMVFSNALTCGMSEPRSGFWPIGETLLSRTLKTLVGFPGFPVELVGVGGLHAAFLNESRTRGPVWRHVQEIRVAHLLRPRYALARGTRPTPSDFAMTQTPQGLNLGRVVLTPTL